MLTKLQKEVLTDNIILSANTLAEHWESQDHLKDEDVCHQLTALLNVIQGNIDYTDFKDETAISSQSWLQ